MRLHGSWCTCPTASGTFQNDITKHHEWVAGPLCTHTWLSVLWLGSGSDSFLEIDDAQSGSWVHHADGKATIHQHLRKGQPMKLYTYLGNGLNRVYVMIYVTCLYKKLFFFPPLLLCLDVSVSACAPSKLWLIMKKNARYPPPVINSGRV